MNTDGIPQRIEDEHTVPEAIGQAPPSTPRRVRDDALVGLPFLLLAVACALALVHGLARAGGN